MNSGFFAKEGLSHGKYATDVTLVYNGGKEAKTTCGFSVDKAVLKATYSGDDLYYHETLAKGSVKVTGFVTQNGVVETPETATGYVAQRLILHRQRKRQKSLHQKAARQIIIPLSMCPVCFWLTAAMRVPEKTVSTELKAVFRIPAGILRI